MIPLVSDPALYYSMSNSILIELTFGYADGHLQARKPSFKPISSKTHEKFEMGDDESPPCTFSSFNLGINDIESLNLYKRFYLIKHEQLPHEAPFTFFC